MRPNDPGFFFFFVRLCEKKKKMREKIIADFFFFFVRVRQSPPLMIAPFVLHTRKIKNDGWSQTLCSSAFALFCNNQLSIDLYIILYCVCRRFSSYGVVLLCDHQRDLLFG